MPVSKQPKGSRRVTHDPAGSLGNLHPQAHLITENNCAAIGTIVGERASQHYVPQMYMRLFSINERSVAVYVLSSDHLIRQAPIKGQACQKYFYGKDGGVEKAFGTIEGRTAPILKGLVQGRIPTIGSYEHEALMFYLGLQHSRTADAAAQFGEAAVKTLRFLLRTQFELEGNQEMLDNLDLVKIERTNPVVDSIEAATVGASLLTDLNLLMIVNESDIPFISSDVPVTLHNRLYEASPHTDGAGYASVGLQLFIAVGPRHLLLAYDVEAYEPVHAMHGHVTVRDGAIIQLLNDLQWEAADLVILASPDMAEAELTDQAARWRSLRCGQRTIFRSEVSQVSNDKHLVRHGVGGVPSTIKLDLPFLRALLPNATPLGPFEVAPVRSTEKVAKAERAFERLEEIRRAMRQRQQR